MGAGSNVFEIARETTNPLLHLHQHGDKKSVCGRPVHDFIRDVSMSAWGTQHPVLKNLTWCSKCQRCQTCRFWSQTVAQSFGCAELEALCLNNKSPHDRNYTTGNISCSLWKLNIHGAVDEPPDYGERARDAYERDGDG